MNNLFGIKTVYKGVVFRSKLEAEWAEWFDSQKIPWEYEPFKFGRYTPDFGINGPAIFVEVKPTSILRMNSLMCPMPLIVVFGHPGTNEVSYVEPNTGTRTHCKSWNEAYDIAKKQR